MSSNPFSDFAGSEEHLILRGRKSSIEKITNAIDKDIDLLVAGPPGSGRYFLVQTAAAQSRCETIIFDIDCIQATDRRSFIKLLCDAISGIDDLQPGDLSPYLQDLVSQSDNKYLSINDDNRISVKVSDNSVHLEHCLNEVLQFIQGLAELTNKRVLILFRNFTHIRAWELEEAWELKLREKVNVLKDVLYILIGTIGELREDKRRLSSHSKNAEIDSLRKSLHNSFETIELLPLEDAVLTSFCDSKLSASNLMFNPLDDSLQFFLEAVHGSFSDALALTERIILLNQNKLSEDNGGRVVIGIQEVREAVEDLLKDLSTMCETLLLMLPPRQAKLLTCLALDPTDKPHSREYVKKHNLYKGGTMQGALLGLQQKGLIYDVHQSYKVALPLLRLWIWKRNDPSFAH